MKSEPAGFLTVHAKDSERPSCGLWFNRGTLNSNGTRHSRNISKITLRTEMMGIDRVNPVLLCAVTAGSVIAVLATTTASITSIINCALSVTLQIGVLRFRRLYGEFIFKAQNRVSNLFFYTRDDDKLYGPPGVKR